MVSWQTTLSRCTKATDARTQATLNNQPAHNGTCVAPTLDHEQPSWLIVLSDCHDHLAKNLDRAINQELTQRREDPVDLLPGRKKGLPVIERRERHGLSRLHISDEPPLPQSSTSHERDGGTCRLGAAVNMSPLRPGSYALEVGRGLPNADDTHWCARRIILDVS